MLLLLLSHLSRVWFFVTPWTVAHQAPLSLEIYRQEYWSSCHALLQGIFPTQGLKPCFLWLLHCTHILNCWATREVLNKTSDQIRSDHSLRRVQLFATPWIAAIQASLSITNSLEFTQTHVHWVRDAIQPSHPLSSPSPPAPNPSQHQRLFQRVNSSHEVAKVLEFQL